MTLRVVLRRPARQEFEDATLWYEAQRAGLGGGEAAARGVVRLSRAPRSARVAITRLTTLAAQHG